MGKSPKETGGPVVKTGPTAGKNRSRNNDGAWRKKRSDSGKSKKKSGGCFLTTAACEYKGLPDGCYELSVLRDFRDTYLLMTDEGSSMVESYYKIAPAITDRLHSDADLEYIWQIITSCVRSIENKQFDEAVANYRNMVCSLESRLL